MQRSEYLRRVLTSNKSGFKSVFVSKSNSKPFSVIEAVWAGSYAEGPPGASDVSDPCERVRVSWASASAASYSGRAVCRSSLADQEFNNIQVVVMDGHMKGCQTVLLNTHTHTNI